MTLIVIEAFGEGQAGGGYSGKTLETIVRVFEIRRGM